MPPPPLCQYRARLQEGWPPRGVRCAAGLRAAVPTADSAPGSQGAVEAQAVRAILCCSKCRVCAQYTVKHFLLWPLSLGSSGVRRREFYPVRTLLQAGGQWRTAGRAQQLCGH